MKVNCNKREYMCVNEKGPKQMVSLQGEEIKKVEDLKY